MSFLESLKLPDWINPPVVLTALRIFLLLVVGVPALRLLSSLVKKMLKARSSEQARMLAGKAVFYGGMLVLTVTIMNELNFKLVALLGAAGVAGVAIGFASQTSLSNIISGAFLISEGPFAVGDQIQMGELTGIVASIDLLSVKLRTPDNRLIRIPNESLVKTPLINLTHFPIRRLDLTLTVDCKAETERVLKIIKDVAVMNPHCLDEPEPLVLINGFGGGAQNILLGAWCAKEDYFLLKNSLLRDLKQRLDSENIKLL